MGKKIYAVCLGASMALASAAQASTVENFSASGTAAVSLPGSTTTNGTVFQVKVSLESLEFSSGTMIFGTASEDRVDLHGTEAKLSSYKYSGTVLVPPKGSAATVNATGQGEGRDLAKNLRVFSSSAVTIYSLPLGDGFSSRYLDIRGGNAVNLAMRNVSSGAACAAQEFLPTEQQTIKTQVEELASSASFNIVNVDPVNGLVDFSGIGQIGTVERASAGVPGGLDPRVPLAGLGLLLAGLAGSLAFALPRRRQASLATA